MALHREAGQTIGALAQRWECDPANATWVIDRLERLGYAAREASPTDRRAKLVGLTPEGAKAKAAILREFYAAPRACSTLTLRNWRNSIVSFNDHWQRRIPLRKHEILGGDCGRGPQ